MSQYNFKLRIKYLVLISFLFCLTLSTVSNALDNNTDEDIDPFSMIEFFELANGLKVFLAPSPEATLTEVRLEVDVGWAVETKHNLGVSHLLEHVLFRDKGLKDEMTYLQLIKEFGGEANGTTQVRLTSYFASIPAKKGEWLVQNISKMILEPSITEDYVQKEKSTVELERGRPGPITQILGFNPIDLFKPDYLNQDDFWESEFAISFDDAFSLSEEQLSTQKLTSDQVNTHYNDYYFPSNMRLFIAGKFNRENIIQLINEKWANVAAREGKRLPPEQIPQMTDNHPYIIRTVTPNTPFISLGTKLVNVDVPGFYAATSYVEYLAHRFMKEIRNLKGQTYTANGESYEYKGAGYALVTFQTPKENLNENIDYAKSHIVNEAQSGNLTAEQFEELKTIYLAKYKLSGRESNNMMSFATNYWAIIHEFGKFTSPYDSIKKMSLQEFNAQLKKHFKPELKYEVIWQDPYFFAYDYILLYALTTIIFFQFLRKLLLQRFDNTQVRWIRKIRYLPLKLIEVGLIVVGWYILLHVQYPFDYLILHSGWIQSSVIFSFYIPAIFKIILALVIAQGLLSMTPRKLMVHEKDLLLKSISYFSKKIPLTEISSVETITAIGLLFSFKKLLRVNYRFYFFEPLIWRKGILIYLKNGQAYFFSVSAPDKTCQELKLFLQTNETPEQTV